MAEKPILFNTEIKILSVDEAAQIVGMRTIESTYYWARFFEELKDAGLSICKINVLKEQTDDKS